MREFGRRALSLRLCLLISMQCLGGMTVSAAQTGQSPIMGSGDVLGVYLYPGAEETLPEDFECPLCSVGKDMFSEG